MITYVNTVLVGKNKGLLQKGGSDTSISETLAKLKYSTRAEFNTAIGTNAGKFVVESIDDSKFRVGMITNKAIETYVNGDHTFRPIVKWSNEIKIDDIKGMVVTKYDTTKNQEDVVTLAFGGVDVDSIKGKRLVLRLTYKDLPTRYRKWTESYEYVVPKTDNLLLETVLDGIKHELDRNFKRARIDSTISGNSIILRAMPYDDDETVDSISPANKVRFSANMWMTDPTAPKFASKNKYSIDGLSITNKPGVSQVGEWKIVRDAEAGAMGYQGIINRGEGTWPIIKPEMNVQMNVNYDTITLEFENMYRTADDLHRKTKQTLQIFEVTASSNNKIDTVANAIKALVENDTPADTISYNTQKEVIKKANA